MLLSVLVTAVSYGSINYRVTGFESCRNVNLFLTGKVFLRPCQFQKVMIVQFNKHKVQMYSNECLIYYREKLYFVWFLYLLFSDILIRSFFSYVFFRIEKRMLNLVSIFTYIFWQIYSGGDASMVTVTRESGSADDFCKMPIFQVPLQIEENNINKMVSTGEEDMVDDDLFS